MTTQKDLRNLFRGSRLPRRRVMAAAAITGGGLAAASLVGCSTNQPTPGAVVPGAKQPKRGGIAVRAGGSSAGTSDLDLVLDPHVDTPYTGRGLTLIYQNLLGYDPRTWEVTAEIASRWEQPSTNEYIFHLQSGVKWHDKAPANGRDLTAEDVIFSLERIRSDSPRFTASTLLKGATYQVLDKATIKITTPGPDAAFVAKLSGDQMAVLAPEVIERAGVGYSRAEQAVGTGAFMLKAREDGVSAEYIRNPAYWKPGLPYLDGFRTVFFKDVGTAYAALLGKQVDVTLLPGNKIKEYISQQGPTFSPEWYKHDGVVAQLVPNTQIAPFNDARVTRALRLLVDHDEWLGWAEDFFGRGRYGSIFCTALDAWDLSHEEYGRLLEWKQPKDDAVKEALSLLSAAGFTRNTPLRFEFTGQSGQAGFQEPGVTLLQAQWARLGQGVVDARIKLLEGPAYQSARATRDYTYGLFTNAAAVNEPDLYLNQIYRSNANRNYWNWEDPTLDQMIDRQHAIFDIPQRKSIIRDILLYLVDRHPGTICSYLYFLSGQTPRVQDMATEYYLIGRQWEHVWLDT